MPPFSTSQVNGLGMGGCGRKERERLLVATPTLIGKRVVGVETLQNHRVSCLTTDPGIPQVEVASATEPAKTSKTVHNSRRERESESPFEKLKTKTRKKRNN